MAESRFADARFLEEDDTAQETMPAYITSTAKGTMKNVIQGLKADMPVHQLQKEAKPTGGHILLCQADKRKGLYHLSINANSLKVYF